MNIHCYLSMTSPNPRHLGRLLPLLFQLCEIHLPRVRNNNRRPILDHSEDRFTQIDGVVVVGYRTQHDDRSITENCQS